MSTMTDDTSQKQNAGGDEDEELVNNNKLSDCSSADKQVESVISEDKPGEVQDTDVEMGNAAAKDLSEEESINGEGPAKEPVGLPDDKDKNGEVPPTDPENLVEMSEDKSTNEEEESITAGDEDRTSSAEKDKEAAIKDVGQDGASSSVEKDEDVAMDIDEAQSSCTEILPNEKSNEETNDEGVKIPEDSFKDDSVKGTEDSDKKAEKESAEDSSKDDSVKGTEDSDKKDEKESAEGPSKDEAVKGTEDSSSTKDEKESATDPASKDEKESAEDSSTKDKKDIPEDPSTEPKKSKDSSDEEDSPRPLISIRSFSEIAENDDDSDDDIVFVGESESTQLTPQQKAAQLISQQEEEEKRRVERIRARLQKISTTDMKLSGLDMEAQEFESNESINNKTTNGLSKLSLWLSRKKTTPVTYQPPPPPPVFQQPPIRQVLVTGGNQQNRNTYQLSPQVSIVRPQQQQHQPPPPPVSINNRLVWGTPASNILRNQNNPQQQPPRIQNPVVVSQQQQQQIQSFTQLIYDSNTGLLICPPNQMLQNNQQLHFSPGMLVQPTNQPQNRTIRAPTIAPPRPQQPPPPPIRPQTRPILTASQQYIQAQAQNRATQPPKQPPPPPVVITRTTPKQTPNGIVLPAKIPPVNSASSAPNKSGITAGNQKPIPGTVDENDKELQNKTFPSLVVHVKTCLGSKNNKVLLAKSRSDLDASVKSVLVNTPAQFTEWLMRKGLLKLDHTCDLHRSAFKLGMYSDTSRQPFSGGYVWTSECCTDKQISVFSGSIFEGSQYPPGTVLKLIYHWSCQTPANNVLQWVKVSSLYLKNFFTLLRAVSISWLHELCPPLGGEGKYVEIGVITLGSSAETSRGVKNVNVEILGVFDPLTKIIRMKVINSMQSLIKDKNKANQKTADSTEQGARAFQILWPLTHWVDKRSILLVDGIIDKALFHELGFKNIQTCGGNTNPNSATNMNVMNYLRNLVPKMFSSTLSVLSKSIVQQFLDELSWREIHGQTVLQSYDNMLDHISKLTRLELIPGDSLIARLNKVNQNPFIDWSYTKQTRRCPQNTIPLSLRNEPGIRECIKFVMRDSAGNKVAVSSGSSSSSSSVPPLPPLVVTQTTQKKKDDKMISAANLNYYKSHYLCGGSKDLILQTYYYGKKDGASNGNETQPFIHNLKCPLCVKTFMSSNEIPKHLYSHVGPGIYRSENAICNICLKDVPTGMTVAGHINMIHKHVGANYACKICEINYKNEEELTIHMWDLHNKRETPYRCAICNYASAFHYEVIQHFQDVHPLVQKIQCPFCLKQFSASSYNCLKSIISHFQSHNSKKSKKCPRCTLSFLTDTDLDNHLLYHYTPNDYSNWTPYQIPQGEFPIPMMTPPLTKTPIPASMSNTLMFLNGGGYSSATPPAPKKPKLSNPPKQKKVEEVINRSTTNKKTLNVSIAVPIDTNEKFGGTTYKINLLPEQILDSVCLECDKVIEPGHFIGKLVCTKCRYITSCKSSMDIHHDRNHNPNSKSIKPVMKTNKIKKLNQPLFCKCGYSDLNPFLLATHLEKCETITAYPINLNESRSETETPLQPPSINNSPSRLPSMSPSKRPSLTDLLGPEPVTTFEDMLNLDESMSNTLESLNLPPILSPTNVPPLLNSPTFGEPQTPMPNPSNNTDNNSGGVDWDSWDTFSSLTSSTN